MSNVLLRGLNAARKSKGWTVPQLSKVSRVSEATIWRAERGICDPNISSVVAMAAALEVGVDALIASQCAPMVSQ